MAPSNDRANPLRLAAGAACIFAACALLCPQAAAGQYGSGRLSIDSLQLAGLSLDFGHIRPIQAEAATVFGIAADYGRLSPTLRLRFEGSYWESRLTDAVVRTFTDSLRAITTDPSHDDAIAYSRVRLYDVTIGGGVRWLPRQATVVQPFLGAGLAMHVINAAGPLINGTFVEQLFDSFSTGLFAETGVLVKPLREIGVDVRVRGDLVNGFSSVSLRVGASYYFGPLRRIYP